jgi:hypothetical protein
VLLISKRLRAGMVWVNTYRAVSFMSPFGGYKRSGIGRESGKEAIYEYLQQRAVGSAPPQTCPIHSSCTDRLNVSLDNVRTVSPAD